MDWRHVKDNPCTTPPPAAELLTISFRVKGTSGRALRCAVYRIVTGLELRLEYEDRDDDVMRSQLFTVHDDDAIVASADQWHHALIARGFHELGR